MPTSPTSKSALQSGAAKDDHVGGGGDFTFTIADLLGNDPGGAAKVDVHTQFFFGSTAADQADQAGYLSAHGIHDNGNGTFTLLSGADINDFDYFVQIGNKGTWSQAHVTVDDRPDAPPPEPHAGDLLFEENFDTYGNLDHGSYGTVNLSQGPSSGPSVGHGWAIKGDDDEWHGVSGEVTQGQGIPNSIESTSGGYWLDTQNSPGGIDITNWFVDPTGGDFLLSFDLGIHDFGTGPKEETNDHATFQVKVDGIVVADLSYKDVFAKAASQHDGQGTEVMGHFDLVVPDSSEGTTAHTISFVDTTPQVDGGNYVGFALDTIQVHDWLI